jgi:hypothetical protein
MAPPAADAVKGSDHYGDGFVRVSRGGEKLDELTLRFRRPSMVKVQAAPAKAKYVSGDIINLAPSFTHVDEKEALYAETGAVTCRLEPASIGYAKVSPLATRYGRQLGGIEVVPQRANVVIGYRCVPAAGLGFTSDAVGSIPIGM